MLPDTEDPESREKLLCVQGGTVATPRRTGLRKVGLACTAALALALLASAALLASSAPRHRGDAVRHAGLLSDESLEAWERLNRFLADTDASQPAAKKQFSLSFNNTKLYYTQCVVDITQSAAYLGQAMVLIDKSLTYEGYQCPDSSRRGCAVMVQAVNTCMIWLASYLSLAASSCAASINPEAACAADVTGIAANLAELATVSTAASDDCYFGDPSNVSADSVLAVLNRTRHLDYSNLGRRLDGAGPLARLVANMKAKEQQQHERDVDVAMCVFDAVQGASYVVRAVKQVIGAIEDGCLDPKVCSVNVLNLVSSFAWTAQFISLLVGDCSTQTHQPAYCAADISDIAASTASLVATSISLEMDCDASKMPKKIEIVR